ncbi:MAG: DNA gyrase subunit A [Deferribacterales bacterium]|nr:DNA gyrase subunit A [Deferribacterales bacterium]
MDNIDINKNIENISIEETLKNSYLDYAMSVIAGRALPDARDGLKPVHRRVLYTMNEMGVQYNKPNKKSARIVGDTMGKLHPHGDSAIYDTLVRLAQDFSMRYPLVIGQGNFGSIDGDSAAASRYTEARMARISDELMADINCDTVDFVPNYDGSLTEPTVFPTKIPNLLINGISGIAVGMATNIPPHNLTEVMDALLYMINADDYNREQLFNIIKGPDFPSAGIIMGRGDIINAYKTGRASIKIRAKAQIVEAKKGGREQIVITEIPYQVNKAALVEKIAELVNEKRIPGITDIRDVSNMHGIKIIIDVKKGESAEVILNRLYKFTALESSFGINMVALVGGRPRVMTLEDILNEFIDHRIEVVTRRTRYLLRKAEERLHIVEGLRIAVNNIDEVVAIIKASKDTPSAKGALRQRFGLSDVQAQAILDMRLAKLTGLEIDKLNEEYESLLKDIEYYNSILNSRSVLMGVIREEFEDIKNRFGDERRTEISDEVDDFNYEDLIPNDDTVVTITHNGYIKRTLLSSFAAQKRGGKGKTGATAAKADDFVEKLMVTTNHTQLFVFTNRGKVHFLKVYQIPEQGRDSKGRHISNLLTLDNDERIASILTVPEKDDTMSILFGTKMGVVKRVMISEFKSGRSGITALKLREGDEIVASLLTTEQDSVFIATKKGKTIQFSASDVRPMGRVATGVKGITLEKKDEVVSLEVIKTSSQILTVTALGYGKCTPIEEYRVQARGGKGLKLMKVTGKTGMIVGAKQVTVDNDVMLVTKNGKTIRISVGEISVLKRDTQGVRLMNTSGEEIVSFSVVPEGVGDDDNNENSSGESGSESSGNGEVGGDEAQA